MAISINEGTTDIPVTSPVQQDDYTMSNNATLVHRLNLVGTAEIMDAAETGCGWLVKLVSDSAARIAELEAALTSAAQVIDAMVIQFRNRDQHPPEPQLIQAGKIVLAVIDAAIRARPAP